MRVTIHNCPHRAGQIGEINELNVPALKGPNGESIDIATLPGSVYVSIAPLYDSRSRDLADKALKADRHGAATLQPWENLEVAA